MKIGLIGPGIMSIPPPGWGAIEILIWDYYNILIENGHLPIIINNIRQTPYEQMDVKSNYCKQLIKDINDRNFDFVHIHYDCLYHIIPHLTCSKIALTSHYPYIDQLLKHNNDGYTNIFNYLITNPDKIYNFAVADKDIETFLKSGADKKYIRKLENGISWKNFYFNRNPNKIDRTIYLGKIDKRKNQAYYQNIRSIDFAGPINCNNFNTDINYIGEWTRDDVNTKLTEYGNMLLLSKGEADPIVIKEALIAGLGVVVNYTSGQNLDEQPFITVISDEKVQDINYVEEKLIENRKISVTMRDKIRNYGVKKFDINNICKKYVNIIEKL